MQTVLDKRILALSSNHGQKLNGSFNSNINFIFPNLLRKDPNISYVEVGCINAEIPVSFYIINQYNKYFNFSYKLVGETEFTNVEVILNEGNYQGNNFITEILRAINTVIVSAETYLTIQLSRINGCLTWNIPTNTVLLELILKPYGIYKPLYKILGFDEQIETDILLIQTVPYTNIYPLNLLGINKLLISTNNLLTYNYDSGLQGFSNIISTIEVDQPSYGIILYKNSSLTYNILRIHDLDNFTIEIKDIDNNFIDFNNLDWSITLGLNIYRYLPIYNNVSFNEILGIGKKDIGNIINNNSLENNEKTNIKKSPSIKNDLDLLNLKIPK
jgi:hypothetical protein